MRRLVAGLALGLLLPLTGCASGPKPDPVARDFLAAWAKGDLAAAGRLTDSPAAASALLRSTGQALAVTGRTLRLGQVQSSGNDATAAYDATFTLRGLGEWRYAGSLALRKQGGNWLVRWAPSDVHPRLGPGQSFGRTRTLPPRAGILDLRGRPLLTPTEVVTVSILPSGLRNQAAVLAVLQRLFGIDPATLSAQLAAAKPDRLVPVIPLRRPAYEQVKPAIYSLPGLYFPTSTQLLAPTSTFARPVLGRVGPATAEALAATGPAYQANDDLGLSGLQAAFQRRLAGTASGSVVLRDAAGRTVTTLATFAGTPGRPLRVTLDRQVQLAAEAALAGVAKPAALVAVRPSDGAILAVANAPADSAFDRALVGQYPPGSTFKVVSAAALLQRGIRPDTRVPCPPSVTVDGRVFRNFEGETAGNIPFARDFAISCNAAFVGLSARLGGSALPDAARALGVGAGWKLPIPAYAGSVPPPASAVERAADTIGQGRVSVSPLNMALAAAAVASGTWRPPVLVTDPAQPAAAQPVPLAVAPQLRSLMRSVVTSGTAAPAFAAYAGPAVYGKTGTAEYGTGNPPPTHAWFIGFRGDLAFAVVVEGGGVGGRVAAPVAVSFLSRL